MVVMGWRAFPYYSYCRNPMGWEFFVPARTLIEVFLFIVAFSLTMHRVALMSWVKGSFCAFWKLASKSDFKMPQLIFLRQIWLLWHPPGWYRVNTCPMAASGGIYGSPRPAVSVNVLVIAPAHRYGLRSSLRRWCIRSLPPPFLLD
jgi:hypothetical protein